MWKRTLSIVLTLLLTSCQTKEEKTVSALKINLQEGDLPSLHPHPLMIYLRGIGIAKNLYEGLTRIDAEGKPQLAGAETLEISPDRLRYTFTLRTQHWSDGTPVTARQYEEAWKQALSPTSNCSRADLLYMIKNAKEAKKGEVPLDAVGVKAISDNTLVVDLDYPSPYFLELAAQPICFPLADPRAKEPTLFNGPFVAASWKRGDTLSLAKNPHFWNKNNVSLDQIHINFIQDSTTAFNLYEKKELDWVGVPLTHLSTEQILDLKQKGALYSHPVDRAFWVFLNTQNPLLSSSTIRRALSHAIDRNSIAQHILIGGSPLNKILPAPLLPLLPPSRIQESPTEALALFDQGLSELNLTRETIPPLQISYSQQSNRKQVAEYLQQAWSQALGIQVQLISQEWNILRTQLETGDYQIAGCFEAAFYKDPLELLEKLVEITSNNFPKWTSPAFTDLVLKAKREADPDQRMQTLSQAEQMLMEEMPFIPITSDTLLYAHPPALKGYTFDYVGAVDFSYATFEKQ